MNKKSLTVAAIGILAIVSLGGCHFSSTNNADEQEAAQQGKAYDQMIRNQPAPAYDWSLERQVVTEIYDARQQAVNTFSYVLSPYTGKVMWSCPSIGFPIPYSTQLTNPEKIVSGYSSNNNVPNGVALTLPQQEPNGMYPPPESEATWVQCVNSQGQVTPVYEELPVTTFVRKMQVNSAGQLVPVPGTKANLKIDVKVGNKIR